MGGFAAHRRLRMRPPSEIAIIEFGCLLRSLPSMAGVFRYSISISEPDIAPLLGSGLEARFDTGAPMSFF